MVYNKKRCKMLVTCCCTTAVNYGGSFYVTVSMVLHAYINVFRLHLRLKNTSTGKKLRFDWKYKFFLDNLVQLIQDPDDSGPENPRCTVLIIFSQLTSSNIWWFLKYFMLFLVVFEMFTFNRVAGLRAVQNLSIV